MAKYTHLFWWDEDARPDDPNSRHLWCSTARDLGGGYGWCDHLNRRCHAGPEPPERAGQ